MAPEISILKHILTYEHWSKVRDQLSAEDFPKELQPIYSVVCTFHSGNSDCIDLGSSDLNNLVFSAPVKNKEYTQQIVDNILSCDASASTTVQLINALRRTRILKQISLLSYEIAEGRSNSNSATEELNTLIQSCGIGIDSSLNTTETSQDFVTDDLQILIDDAVSTPGLRWRLNTMNQMLGSLRKGDFGFIFARPETGKTTFLASEITYMATQLKAEDGPILWINNEEQGSKVMLRVYQAALGVDLTTLYSDIEHHKQEYQRLTHGKLKLYDSGIIHKSTVEKLCKQYKPSLIIFDQIGKITGFDKDREDLVQGAIYQWARELAKEYCPVIGVCQADGSGEGVRWLTMSNVADAKTAKQAEADWILGIGKVNDAGYDNLRFLHLSKNKLTGDKDTIPDQRHGRRETLIEPGIARYKDI